MNYLLVALGAAIGGSLRYFLSSTFQTPASGSFPWVTLLINVAGSFVLGLVIQLATQKNIISEEMKIFLAVGFCGGFTTFSTFSFETVSLFRSGTITLALLYVAGSNILSIAAALVGFTLGKNS